MRITITGGAGFIGTHLSRRLVGDGHQVRVLDCFSPQIHGETQTLASDLQHDVELMREDVRDRDALRRALDGAEAVIHLAAETGTGQSMYEVARYSEVNLQGTSVLMDLLVNDRTLHVGKVVVASSRAIYGEGRYQCHAHGTVFPKTRRTEAMQQGQFEPECPICTEPCQSLPTTEDSPFAPASFYGLTKQVQEQTVLLMAGAIGMDAVALRYQNVYGPGQSLQNPYTGILAVFSNLARKRSPIKVFEDGKESRDFVYVEDVVDATVRCVGMSHPGQHSFNVGSGKRTTVLEVAEEIRDFWQSESSVEVTGQYRIGDIRHNVADLRKPHSEIGYVPRTSFQDGLRTFLGWVAGQDAAENGYQRSLEELRARGLFQG